MWTLKFEGKKWKENSFENFMQKPCYKASDLALNLDFNGKYKYFSFQPLKFSVEGDPMP